jgi:hypothetical protein
MRLGQRITVRVWGSDWSGRVVKIGPGIIWAEGAGGRLRWFHRDSVEG